MVVRARALKILCRDRALVIGGPFQSSGGPRGAPLLLFRPESERGDYFPVCLPVCCPQKCFSTCANHYVTLPAGRRACQETRHGGPNTQSPYHVSPRLENQTIYMFDSLGLYADGQSRYSTTLHCHKHLEASHRSVTLCPALPPRQLSNLTTRSLILVVICQFPLSLHGCARPCGSVCGRTLRALIS